MVNIFGVDIRIEIIIGIIAGLFIVVCISLKLFLDNRKQYKDLLKNLGRIEQRTLETMIGLNADCSLKEQHDKLSRQIGNTDDFGNLTAQIGDTSNHGNLTAQHTRIFKAVSDISNQMTDEQRRREVLSGYALDITKTYEHIGALVELLAKQNLEIHTLTQDNIELTDKYNKLLDKTNCKDQELMQEV